MAAVGEGPFKGGLAGRAADEVQARSLYEQDILLWVEDTVAKLRAGDFAHLDLVHLSEKRAVISQLTRLMLHVIKWQEQPDKRSASWVILIRSARRGIAASQEEMPSLNRDFLISIWKKCFLAAQQDARDEMGKQLTVRTRHHRSST